MRAVYAPPDSAPGVPRVVLGGVVAVLLTLPGDAARAQDAADLVALDRTEVERLLGIDSAPPALAVVGASIVAPVPPLVSAVWLAPDQYLAARLAGPAELVPGEGNRLQLPFRYARPSAPGTVGFRLVAAIELEGGGLRYVADREVYEGAFLIGVEDAIRPEARRLLAPAVRLHLSVDGGTVTPSVVQLSSTNIPFTRVTVRSGARDDSVAVRVRAPFDERGVTVRLPVRRPAVSVTPASRRIFGFGLESTRLTLTAPLAGLAGAATAVVAVDRGSATPASLVLGHDGVAVVSLRSRGLGTATVSVTGPAVLGATTIVEFVWPITLLGAALLGAALGVAAAALRARVGHRRPSLSTLGSEMVLGTAVGAVSAAVLAAVTNVAPLEIPIRVAEATVFLLAAASALGGHPTTGRRRRRSGVPRAGARA